MKELDIEQYLRLKMIRHLYWKQSEESRPLKLLRKRLIISEVADEWLCS